MRPLIITKQSTRYPSLSIRKYHRRVFYDNLWHLDPLLLESRGHVVDSNGKLVVNPPTKVFNYRENGTTIPYDEFCLYTTKINGFLACLTYNPELDEVLVSTTGSLDSNYVQMAREYLQFAILVIQQRKASYTYFFEICHHDDPHIIPENVGAYLLGMRVLDDTDPYTTSLDDQHTLDTLARQFRVGRPLYGLAHFSDLLKTLPACKHEGYMVYGLTSKTTLKLKSPYYLVLKAIARKSDILSLNRNRVSEEYYPLLDHLISIKDTFNQLSEQDRLDYIRNYLETNYA